MELQIILGFIKQFWKPLLGGVLVLVALLYVQGLRLDVAQAETKIVTLTSENQILADNNAKLLAGIEASNQALTATNAAASRADAKFSQLKGAVMQQTVDLDQKLTEILGAKDPQTCTDSIAYLISNIGGFKK